ncbi:Uncharacterised protein [Oligella ureolytica]|uniref:Uncharacterized protein n=1 Tax=Oligella ureolytica TaxID=90244 RepID=A0A378XGU0_9BURK|nr:hypothetical protein [Oligella ureolytica]QPT39152.1 hypothetical protein I6G29_08120 [Oligella ureolytica]SUA55021.1 Uncharacterised protein [Oligella ureolytica]SUA56237.1 Uncharacterised protein [Oligella ureolytica]
MTEITNIAKAKRWNKRAYTLIALYAISLFVGTFSAQRLNPDYANAFGWFYIIWSIIAILGTLICAVRSLNLVPHQNPHAKYLITVSIFLAAIVGFIFYLLNHVGNGV